MVSLYGLSVLRDAGLDIHRAKSRIGSIHPPENDLQVRKVHAELERLVELIDEILDENRR